MLISTNTGLHSARLDQPRMSIFEAIDLFAEVGFEAVDVNFCGTIYEKPFRYDPILEGDFRERMLRLKEKIEEKNLVVSHTHPPFYHYEPLTNPLSFRDETFFHALEASGILGAPYAVVHPQRDENKVTLVDETVEMLKPFRDAAEKWGVTLAVENMFSTSACQLAEIADKLECVVCWDAGHANVGGFDQRESILLLGDRLKVLHLHDNYGVKDDHNSPYFGTIDWKGFVKALNEIHYDGTFNYEVNADRLPANLRKEHARYLVQAAKDLLGRAD